MKNQENVEPVTEDADGEGGHEEWEFEYTQELVEDFLESEIIPALYTFDFNNHDENYIQGVASYALFAKLIMILLESGWTPEDMKYAIDEFATLGTNEILH